MAIVSECLQSIVVGVGDDDSALVGDARSKRIMELAWLIALRAELEQERAIDRRHYLQSIMEGINDDDSMSIIIDHSASCTAKLARMAILLTADLEQEREIDRRQEHQAVVEDIDDDDAMMMLVDRKALRTLELETS